jgi:hypothetical protein
MAAADTEPRHPNQRRSGHRAPLARCAAAARARRNRLIEGHPDLQRLLPLLMKQRNGARWAPEEREALHRELLRVRPLPPYLKAILVAGSALGLTLLARWLDRRRGPQRQG